MAINKEWKAAQQKLIDAAAELNRVWEDIDSTTVDETADEYPNYLPSFDEFVIDLMKWRDATTTFSDKEVESRRQNGIIAV